MKVSEQANVARAGQQLVLERGVQRVEATDQREGGQEERDAVDPGAPVGVLDHGEQHRWQEVEAGLLAQHAEREAGAAAHERPQPPPRIPGQHEGRDGQGHRGVVKQHRAMEENAKRGQRHRQHGGRGGGPAEAKPPGQDVEQRAAGQEDKRHQLAGVIDGEDHRPEQPLRLGPEKISIQPSGGCP